MSTPSKPGWIPAAVLAATVVLATVLVFFFGSPGTDREPVDGREPPPKRRGPETYERTVTEYKAPETPADDLLLDDKPDDRPRPALDPAFVDRRPFGEWAVNSSAAVLKLDLALIQPDTEADLLVLHPSYAKAIEEAGRRHGTAVLPSVNMIEGKIKQFDDGLYAALDLAYYTGLEGTFVSHVEVFRRIHERLPAGPAAEFLAAGLEIAGVKVPGGGPLRARFRNRFESAEVRSKPIGFYTWGDEPAACFRFLRYFQHEFTPSDESGGIGIPAAVAAVLEKDPALAGEYRKAVDFFSRLTNPRISLTAADLIGGPVVTAAEFDALCRRKAVRRPAVALFPAATSRETALFERMFGGGLPPGGNLMRELIRAIRAGKVDLTPKADSGWYDHQVYALETLLTPSRGPEGGKLVLSRAYKQRMLEAFAAIITTRRETHVRDLGRAKSEEGIRPARPTPPILQPQLHVEPAPSFYLRTARSYEFLRNFLEAAVGRDALSRLHGLREGGRRKLNLAEELHQMQVLLYGLYLVSCDDLGLRPELKPDECPDRQACYAAALRWLPAAANDPDLAVDMRVAVPIFVDGDRVRCWGTAGVRMARLDVGYAVAPLVRLRSQADAKWQEPLGTSPAGYLLPVVEFVEFELAAGRVFNRSEWRAVCDQGRTREGIMGLTKGRSAQAERAKSNRANRNRPRRNSAGFEIEYACRAGAVERLPLRTALCPPPGR